MGPFNVGQGPVVFDKRYQAVPKAPTPNLAGLGGGFGVTNTHLGVGALVMLGICSIAIVKGKKGERRQNAKMLVGAGFLAITALGIMDATRAASS
jgi:hypothetical protein